MAQVPEVDFSQFVAQKKEGHVGGGDGHDYAYISDRQTRAAFQKMAPVEYAVAATVRLFKAVGKNQLLGSTVRVTERQFPRLHALNVQSAQTLGIATPTLYVGQNPHLNAGTFGTNDDAFILVNGSLIDHFSDAEILDILGHECGHIQNNHVVYMTTLYFLTNIVNAFVGWFAYPARIALMAWSRRAEITCDRAGLLVVKDLDVSMKGLMKLTLGSKKLYEELNLDAYLEQYEDGKNGIGRLNELFASHPYVPKRVMALQAFAKSALYRKAAGLGDDGLSMEEVDNKVHEIIKVVA
ncbi:MAG: M48 family metallopeptidase [Polyangiales bacterium]